MGMHSIGGKSVSIQADCLDLTDTAPYRVFIEVEPHPVDQSLGQQIIDNHKFYNLILTWRERTLQACPNAVPYLHSGPYLSVVGNDYALPPHVGEYTTPEGRYVCPLNSAKAFSASFLTSSQNVLTGHILRQEIFSRLPEAVGALPIWKHHNPPRVCEVQRGHLFTDFQYHISVENCRLNNWRTEKVLDCFMGKAIPIYWGCPNLEEYFNTDGVIRFENYDDLIRVLQSITPETYQEKAAAIEDNFNRVLPYCKANRLGEIIEANL
jgi:hypothetical protein